MKSKLLIIVLLFICTNITANTNTFQDNSINSTFLSQAITCEYFKENVKDILYKLVKDSKWEIKNNSSINFDKLFMTVICAKQARIDVLRTIARTLNTELLVYSDLNIFLIKDK